MGYICVFGVKKEKSEAFGKIKEKGKGLLRLEFQGYLRLQCRKEELLFNITISFLFSLLLVWN